MNKADEIEGELVNDPFEVLGTITGVIVKQIPFPEDFCGDEEEGEECGPGEGQDNGGDISTNNNNRGGPSGNNQNNPGNNNTSYNNRNNGNNTNNSYNNRNNVGNGRNNVNNNNSYNNSYNNTNNNNYNNNNNNSYNTRNNNRNNNGSSSSPMVNAVSAIGGIMSIFSGATFGGGGDDRGGIQSYNTNNNMYNSGFNNNNNNWNNGENGNGGDNNGNNEEPEEELTLNAYEVLICDERGKLNDGSTTLYEIVENTNSMYRKFGPCFATFFEVYETGNTEIIMKIEKPCGCRNCICCLPTIRIFDGHDNIIGSIIARCACCNDFFDVFNDLGEYLGGLSYRCCQVGRYCRHPSRPFRRIDIDLIDTTHMECPGSIGKTWTNTTGAGSLFSDIYHLTFPRFSSVLCRQLYLASVIMMDFLFFEQIVRDGDLAAMANYAADNAVDAVQMGADAYGAVMGG